MKLFLHTLLTLIFITTNVFADLTIPPKSVEKQYLYNTPINVNSGFEQGLTGWSVSEASTMVLQTALSNIHSGARSISWNPSVAGTLTSGTFTPNANLGGMLTVECYIKTADADYDLQLYDTTAAAAVQTMDIVTDGADSAFSLNKFVYPMSPSETTRTFQIRLNAPGNESVLYADDCRMYFDASAIPVSVNQVYSAAISGTDVVTNENVDWINGNCTNASTGVQTCTFTTGFFTQAPNCVATTGSGSTASVPTISSTSVTVNTRDTSNALTNASSQLSCQRSEPNSGFAVRMDQTNYGWTDYTPTITNCGAATVTYAQHKRSGPNLEIRMAGVCTTVSGSALKVSLPTGLTGNVSGDTLLDGDVGFTYTGGDARGIVPIMLTGERTVVQFARNNSASVYTAIPSNQNMANGQTFTFNVKIPILGWTENQSAPLIIGGVTSSYQGTARTEVAKINCDSGSAIMSQLGSWVTSVGNVASGACAITLTSGIFSSTPYCFATMNDSDFGATAFSLVTTPSSATAVSVDCYAGGDCTNYDFNIQCTGPR